MKPGRQDFSRFLVPATLTAAIGGCMAPYELRPLLEAREIGQDLVYESAEERDAHPNRYFYDVAGIDFGPLPRILFEPRLRLEISDNRDLDDTAADTKARALVRTRVLLDSGRFHRTLNYRIEFQDSQEVFSGAGETDQDAFDLRQAYLMLGRDRAVWGLKLGRQEIDLGSGRLLGANWHDNRDRAFDGGRLVLANRWGRFEPRQWTWRFDVLAASPVRPAEGEWNTLHDEPNVFALLYSDRRNFPFHIDGGLIVTATRAGDTAGELGGLDREVLTTLSAAIRGNRFGRAEGLDLDAEAGVQFGHRGPDRHLAGFFSCQTSYVFPTPWQVRLRAGLETASGDADPVDGRSGTFAPPFPGDMRDRLGLLDLVGLRNIEAVTLGASFGPIENFRVALDFRWLRLQEVEAGWLDSDGERQVPGPSGPDLGREIDASGRYRITTLSGKELWIDGGFSIFEPDRDLRLNSGQVRSLYLQTALRF
jgi:hypothetical protein